MLFPLFSDSTTAKLFPCLLVPRLCNEDVSLFHCLTDGLFGSAAVKGLQRMLDSVGLALFAVLVVSQGHGDIITL